MFLDGIIPVIGSGLRPVFKVHQQPAVHVDRLPDDVARFFDPGMP